jgi:Domain of unknown function (DUF5060)/Protein of unknown function (DUF4038)/Putative collagen-binding domain of a collagenase
MTQDTALSVREVGEWALVSRREYENPFIDVAVDAEFVGPGGTRFTVPGFYDGDGVWRVRFSPGEPGRWSYCMVATPADPELAREGSFEVAPRQVPGFLRSTPGQAWGFHYESGEPALLIGDTVYNLVAETYLGNDIRPYLSRRAGQGYNLVRMSLAVQPFCPPNAYAHWYDRRIWAWGGSEWSPQFDRFNLGYFRALDETVRLVDEAGLGIEMILETPGGASPFGRRDLFTAESEELWIRYLVARYDAYTSVYFWNLANEYEYLTNEYRHNQAADRWALRVAHLVKRFASHGHPVAVHSGPVLPPFAYRFRADPDVIDTVLYQDWGTVGPDDAWLAAGIEDGINAALAGWKGSAVFAEYGYETAPELAHIMPGHQHLDPDHTRRGAWRAAFCGIGMVAGFHQQWWGFGDYAVDQPGVTALTRLREFLTGPVDFARLHPAGELVLDGPAERGHRPLALATAGRDVVAVYLPVGGEVSLDLPTEVSGARWFDPRTGELADAVCGESAGALSVKSPGGGPKDRPHDWALVVNR